MRCTKYTYKTYVEAFMTSGRLLSELGQDLEIYQCPKCTLFHLRDVVKRRAKFSARKYEIKCKIREKRARRKQLVKERMAQKPGIWERVWRYLST